MSVSIPDMESVSEDGGSVQVCATLSVGAGVTINIPISITLATSDGKASFHHCDNRVLSLYRYSNGC